MNLVGLDELSNEGAELIVAVSSRNVIEAHIDFETWVENGAKWLRLKFPESGMTSKWMAISSSSLLEGGAYSNDALAVMRFKQAVQVRLEWLSNLPYAFKNKEEGIHHHTQDQRIERHVVKLQTASNLFVDPGRISELQLINSRIFDVRKLIRMCEELNICYMAQCYISMILVMRAIIDHVPPVYGKKNFGEIANNYNGSKSFKKNMLKLEQEMRNMADMHIHTHIRQSDHLPNLTQIDFSNSLDLLLAETIALLKHESSS